MALFEQNWLYSGEVALFGKLVGFGQKWLYLVKSGCIWKKVVVYRQKWLYSGKSSCNRAK